MAIAKEFDDLDPFSNGKVYLPIKRSQFKALTETYGMDYKAAIVNAINCHNHGDGKPEMPKDILDTGKDFMKNLPPCFVNLPVKEK